MGKTVNSKQNRNEFIKLWHTQIKWLLPIIVTVALVCLLYYRLDFHRIANLRQQVNWTFLVIASILTLPFVLLKTLKWHHLLKTSQPKASYALALRSFLIGMGAALFTPARVGELARVACFPGRRLEVLTLVLVDKFIDMSTLLGCFLLSLVLLSPWMGLVGIFGVGCLWILMYTGFKFTKGTKWISQKSWLVERFRLLRQLPRRLIVLNAGFACACFGLMFLQFYLLLSSLQPVGWQVGLTLPIILVVSSLPISIMGLGLREGMAALLLSRYGVPMESAVASAFSLFVINALLPGLVGLALSPTLVKTGKGQKKVGRQREMEEGKTGRLEERMDGQICSVHFTHHVSGQGYPSHSDWRLKDG